MNPFIDSTVARPVSHNHPDRLWASPAMVKTTKESLLPPCRTSALSQPDHAVHLPPASSTGQDVGKMGPGTQGSRRQDGDATLHDKSGSGKRGKALRSILAVGMCMTLSALAGVASKPLVTTGAIVAVGILTPAQVQAVELNSASALELQSLNGIGPKTAEMIVSERTRGGKFSSLIDLSERVRGIGPKKAAALQAAGLKVATGDKPDATVAPPKAR